MTRTLLLVLLFSWVSSSLAAAPATPQQSDSYYVYSGATLRIVHQDPASAAYSNWQVWLYPESVHISLYGTALAHGRWGIIEGSSAGAAMEQLAAAQRFEHAYTALFGPNTWSQSTFSHPIGPIAVAEGMAVKGPTGLVSKANLLNSRLGSVVAMLRASLENAGHSDVASLKVYFEKVRDCLKDEARFYDQISRLPGQHAYLTLELAQLNAAVSQAESGVPRVTAVLPSVKLPANEDWMTQQEHQGSDGTLEVRITEIGSAAWVRQSWTGGDGSMSGTAIVTIVPYQDIGNLIISAPLWSDGRRWALRLQSASQAGFPQSVTSPERTTARHTYAPVDLKTTQRFFYLVFDNPAAAQDAYAFFLYHQQRGL